MQATPTNLASQLLEQYDREEMRIFYQCVVGGGGYNIHYGIFRSPDDSLASATEACVDFLVDIANWCVPITSDSRILDLGSGHGGSTHSLVQRFGCHVQCFNISPNQNEFNRQRCRDLGIEDKVEIETGNFEDGLPESWSERFDIVWSQDVFCHARSQRTLLREIARCLTPGGILAFTDIMRPDQASPSDVQGFVERNAVVELVTPGSYTDWFTEAGLRFVARWDLSTHLSTFFTKMIEQIDHNESLLRDQGIAASLMDNWRSSLRSRLAAQRQGGLSWGAFIAQRPPAICTEVDG